MSFPYSKRLGSASVTTAGVTTIATVPTGKLWVVRDLYVSQTDTGSAGAQVKVAGVPGYMQRTGVLVRFAYNVYLGMHFVAVAGEGVTLLPHTVTAPYSLEVSVHGYELDA